MLTPSFAEGFGMPVVEAMHCGVPVACSRSTGLIEAGGEAAIFFDASDPADIAEKVWLVVTDLAWRESAVVRGRQQAARFTWQRNAHQVADAMDAELRRVARR